MNRSELISAVSQRTGLAPTDVDQVLGGVQSVVTEALVNGDKVTLTGFLTLEIVHRNARSGRNPQTGETMTIPARSAVKLSAGQALKRAVASA